MNIAVLILAAGKSSRMGAVKQLLKINGKTIVENAIENAQKSKATTVFCVLGANYELIKKTLKKQSIEIVFNSKFEEGLSSSIVSGVQFIENTLLNYNAVLVMLADQPDVDYKYLNQFIEQLSENPTQIIASNYNNKAGVPAIFPKQYFKDLLALSGDKGAADFLKKNASNVLKINCKKIINDIDTFKEYQLYLSNKTPN